MNVITPVADPALEADKRFVLTIDPETGEEIKVELLDEFSQEIETDETHTLH